MLVATTISAAGCTLAPGTEPPEIAVPARYRASPATAAAAWPEPQWWQRFGSVELDRLVARARAANLDIAAAAARVEQADEQTRIAGAPLLPTLDLNLSRNYQWQHSGGSSSGGTIVTTGGTGATGTGGIISRSAFGRRRSSDDTTRYQANLSASYELDFWGRNRAAQAAAQAAGLASEFDQATVAIGVDASVANTYFQILALKERLAIAGDNLAIARRVLGAVQARLGVGTATALEVAQQESVVATQRAAIPPLRQQLGQNIDALAILLGLPPEALEIRRPSSAGILVPAVGPGLPSDLLTRRPDVRMGEAQLAEARANVQAARAALFPSIQLTAEGGYASTFLRSLLDPSAQLVSFTSGLTQPIFEGYRLRGQLALDRGRYTELLQTYRKTVLTAFQDVDDALVAVRETGLQEELERRAVVVARRAYAISEAQLREGTVDLITVLNTQQTLFQAQDTYAQVRLANLQAVVSLFQALGGGWTPQGQG